MTSRTSSVVLLALVVACGGGSRSGCARASRADAGARAVTDGGPTSSATTVSMQEWKGTGEGRHRLVVLMHGGGGPTFFTDLPRFKVYPEALAQRGFDVVMPRYFEAGMAHDTSVAVLRNTIDRERSTRGLASNNVGVVGFSRGAFVTLLAASRGLDVAAIVELYGGLSPGDAANVKSMAPTLILHGGLDQTIDVSEARALEKLFTARGIRFEMKIYPDQDHGFREPALTDSVERMTKFFETNIPVP